MGIYKKNKKICKIFVLFLTKLKKSDIILLLKRIRHTEFNINFID